MQLFRGECPGPTERSVCVGRLLVVGRVVHSSLNLVCHVTPNSSLLSFY